MWLGSQPEVTVDDDGGHLVAVDGRTRRPVGQQLDLLSLLQLSLVSHAVAKLGFVQLLQLGLLEVAAADTAVELNAGGAAVRTHHPRGTHALEFSGVHTCRGRNRGRTE